MTKTQKVKDDIHNALWWGGIIGKVILFQALVILVACGVLYLSNFKVQVVKNVEIVSPIVEEVL